MLGSCLQTGGALLQGLTRVLGLQPNEQRSFTGSGLVTAQLTAADYVQAAEQGRIAVGSQLNFDYTQSQTVMDKARSRLSITPPSKTKQPAGELHSPCSDDEALTRRHSTGRYVSGVPFLLYIAPQHTKMRENRHVMLLIVTHLPFT